jgi:hypothetical protein
MLRDPLLPKEPPPDMPLPARARASEGMVQAKNSRMSKILKIPTIRCFLVSIDFLQPDDAGV